MTPEDEKDESQYQTEKFLYRVMADLQDYLLARNGVSTLLSIDNLEHNLRQHTLYYRGNIPNHMMAKKWDEETD